MTDQALPPKNAPGSDAVMAQLKTFRLNSTVHLHKKVSAVIKVTNSIAFVLLSTQRYGRQLLGVPMIGIHEATAYSGLAQNT